MYRWIDHTGELELEIEGASEEAVFEHALSAFGELAGDPGEEAAEFDVELDGGERAALFADWIAELAFLAETRSFVPVAIERLELHEAGLRARVSGRKGDPPHLVKAVTYHRLEFEPSGDGWRARAVLDV